MSYLTKIAAAIAAAVILLLSPGTANADITEDIQGTAGSYADDRRTATKTGTTAQCPEGMHPTFCTHFGLADEPATGGGGGVADETGTTGQIIGWSAAGVAVVSAGVAGVILIRRRHHHGELPHAA